MKSLKSFLLFPLIFISITSLAQWQRIPEFECIFNYGKFSDHNTIWGCGNLGRTFKYSISENTFFYRDFSDSLDFYSLDLRNDSIIVFSGLNFSSQP